jgi:hypothetical protein
MNYCFCLLYYCSKSAQMMVQVCEMSFLTGSIYYYVKVSKQTIVQSIYIFGMSQNAEKIQGSKSSVPASQTIRSYEPVIKTSIPGTHDFVEQIQIPGSLLS